MPNANITPSDFKEGSRDGKIRLIGTYVAFIKDNQDNQRNGRLRVFIPELGGDATKEANWHSVQYASPFAGVTPLTGNKDGDKTMAGSQISYGFWAIPPDLDNQVLVTFANGDLTQGFWFACVYQEGMNHMVPGVANGISTRDDINKINLPVVTEYNKKDADVTKNAGDPKRPIFEPLHNGLDAQGLYADPERGPSTTSARREAPSKVFGLISPRSNTIHIDDNPTNEFIRLRTRSGAQVIIHETTGYIYMISKQGNSWIEISDIGIDMYSKRSISMRGEENVNLHADQNIILHGAGAVHSSGASMTQNSAGNIHQKADNHKTDAKTVKNKTDDPNSSKETDKDKDKKSSDAGIGAHEGNSLTPEQIAKAKDAGQSFNVPGNNHNGQCVDLVKTLGSSADGQSLTNAHTSDMVGVDKITPDNVASRAGMSVMTSYQQDSAGNQIYDPSGGIPARQQPDGVGRDHMGILTGNWSSSTNTPEMLQQYGGRTAYVGPAADRGSYWTIGLKK